MIPFQMFQLPRLYEGFMLASDHELRLCCELQRFGMIVVIDLREMQAHR